MGGSCKCCFFNSDSILWGFGGVYTSQTILIAQHDSG